ncbi:hypothetical protein B0J13DRAFT_452291 [Dactylonectria estremocensis]|uniref:Uncharacterized protein n=1 Tax=Dactylonectria estremocensis TaxID=1079267 RepID=A0A9P9E4F7_9HYPO|nr:hypothetical protein B0J13DRAFT_452291 [Dactylonectria estremocensis]
MSTPPSSDAPWSLAGKTALVTGGSRGIGRAIAIHLARKGVTKLAVTYASNIKAAETALEECRALGVQQTVAIQADALDAEFGPKTISQVLEGLDTKVIDILVNNAFLNDPSKSLPITDANLSNFLEVMQANVFSPVSLTTALLPHLPAYGGRVIYISSTTAYHGNSEANMTYGASKSALQSYTRSLADTFAKQKQATFNSVVVGMTETDAIKNATHIPQGFLEAYVQDTTAADRIGVPDDIAYIVGFLSSEEARWVNGAAVSANGGHKYLIPALG